MAAKKTAKKAKKATRKVKATTPRGMAKRVGLKGTEAGY